MKICYLTCTVIFSYYNLMYFRINYHAAELRGIKTKQLLALSFRLVRNLSSVSKKDSRRSGNDIRETCIMPALIFLCFFFLISWGCTQKETPKKVSLYNKTVENAMGRARNE